MLKSKRKQVDEQLPSSSSSHTTLHSQDNEAVVRVQKSKKRSGFNLFCSSQAGTFTGDGGTVLAEMSRRWSSLNPEEKMSWNQKANSRASFSDQKKEESDP